MELLWVKFRGGRRWEGGGDSHIKVMGCSFLGIEIAVFGLTLGVHDENPLFLPIKILCSIMHKEV